MLGDGILTYLPGGPYPEQLKELVLEALSKGHTDAIVVSSIHPYDFLESGVEMSGFRPGSPQVSIQAVIADIHQISALHNVDFMSIHELFEGGEDLSLDRLQANLTLGENFIARHRLIPERLNVYPLTGLYYSQKSANRMYRLQVATFTLQYGVLIVVAAFLTRGGLRRFFNNMKSIIVLTGIVAVGGGLVLVSRSIFSGFYMFTAVGVACCLGILAGIALQKWQTEQVARKRGRLSYPL